MYNIWFIGDPHFGHKRVAEIRGFETVEAHDEELQKKWHKAVQPNDIVHVLGDISGGSGGGERHALEILVNLPGRKMLKSGNHDSVSGIHIKHSPNTDLFREVFESIQDFGRIKINNENLLLSHFPYASQGDGPGRGEGRYNEFRIADTGQRLIHAHTHHNHPTSGSVTNREFCVSWDAHNDMVNIGKIAKWVQESV